MYRAAIISVRDQVVKVMFIDYGNSEEKSIREVFMLPEELLVTPPYAVKLELASAVEGVATVQNEIIGKVNMFGRNQQGLARTLNQLIVKHN